MNELEAARKLFCGPCEFVAGADTPARIPPARLPEIVFLGRSNVGKSSLLNALTGRKALARVSNTPGRTQQINFFDLAERLMLVDVPGYGYAKASKTDIAGWQRLWRGYVQGRANVRRAMVLIDARHGPMKADFPIFDLLDEAAVSWQIVLTKLDKARKGEIEESKNAVEALVRVRPAAHPELLATSAEKGEGIPELRLALAALAL